MNSGINHPFNMESSPLPYCTHCFPSFLKVLWGILAWRMWKTSVFDRIGFFSKKTATESHFLSWTVKHYNLLIYSVSKISITKYINLYFLNLEGIQSSMTGCNCSRFSHASSLFWGHQGAPQWDTLGLLWGLLPGGDILTTCLDYTPKPHQPCPADGGRLLFGL